jgi:GIY-YIG catalytic domain/NUMOD1 domain
MCSIPRNICGIYKITNLINGMSYIGQSRNIEARWRQHKCLTSSYGHNVYLYNAILKYGVENFLFSVLEECEVNRLDELERELILKHDSLRPNGYNLKDGGNTNGWQSEETKTKISLSNSDAVNQFTKDGKYIRTFASIATANNDLGIRPGHTTNIGACCRGKYKTFFGYQWRYAKDGTGDIGPIKYNWNPNIEHNRKTAILRQKPIDQFTIYGDHIATFESGIAAKMITGVNSKHISACCRGKRKTAGGFLWRYASGDHHR